MEWSETPDQLTVHQAIIRRGNLRAELQAYAIELTIEQARIGMVKPRDPHARVVGIDEQSSTVLLSLQRRIAEIRAELDHVEADIDFLMYHKDMFKALAYKERY